MIPIQRREYPTSLAAATAPARLKAMAYPFGLVAFVYLTTEELMTEAHEKADAPWITVLLFAGFVGLAIPGGAPSGRYRPCLRF